MRAVYKFASCLFSVVWLLFACMSTQRSGKSGPNERPNVLFIMVDDLKPLLNAYGEERMITPNMDRLAQQGVLFENAYCNIAVCGASRASLITGVRPSARRFMNYKTWASKDFPDARPLHAVFQEAGYETVSLGKVIHHAEDFSRYWDKVDGEFNHFQYRDPVSIAVADALMADKGGDSSNPLSRKGPAYESAAVADDAYSDGQLAGKALRELNRLVESPKPFFLAVGFVGPHLPFIAPAKYWEMYDPEDIKLASNPFFSANVAADFFHNSHELRGMYTGIPDVTPLPDTLAKKLRHGYYACVSYTDAMIGLVLDALHDLALDDDTIVVLWSDHGYFLGEHTMWNKHSTFVDAARIPLIIAAPGMAKGDKTQSLVESVDIYPTLCDLADIDVPAYLHGKSIAPILKDPEVVVKSEIFTRFGNQEAIINNRYAYSQFIDDTGRVKHEMLYDLQEDPEQNTSISKYPQYEEIVDGFKLSLETMRNQVESSPINPAD